MGSKRSRPICPAIRLALFDSRGSPLGLVVFDQTINTARKTRTLKRFFLLQKNFLSVNIIKPSDDALGY